jgi:TPR repeat protein
VVKQTIFNQKDICDEAVATIICKDCQKFFCDDCLKISHRGEKKQGHLLNLNSLTTEESSEDKRIQEIEKILQRNTQQLEKVEKNKIELDRIINSHFEVVQEKLKTELKRLKEDVHLLLNPFIEPKESETIQQKELKEFELLIDKNLFQKYLKRCVFLQTKSIPDDVIKKILHFRHTNAKEVLRVCDEYLETNHPIILVYKAESLKKLGSTDEAKELLHQVINFNSKDVKYFAFVGKAYYLLGNYEKAVDFFQKASEQGNFIAQFNLAYCFDEGIGIEKNFEKAFYWYSKSAEAGDFRAQCNLGNCYTNGQGVKADPIKAFYWFKKSTEQDYSTGQCNLGLCYQSGIGIEQDYSKAAHWFHKASDQGNSSGQFYLGLFYYQIEKNYEQAFNFFKKSASKGNPTGQYHLGNCFYNGHGVEQDFEQSTYWFQKSAEKNDNNAQYALGLCYEKGLGIDRDQIMAAYWYKKAYLQGNENAKKKLIELSFLESEE